MDKTHSAEFLIDQFNKYVAWAHIYSLPNMLSLGALAFSVLAILSGLSSTLLERDAETFKGLLVLAGVVFFITSTAVVSWNDRTITGDRQKLSLLMYHWQEHSSLPDDLTFHKIAEEFKKAEDLEKFLQERQPK